MAPRKPKVEAVQSQIAAARAALASKKAEIAAVEALVGEVAARWTDRVGTQLPPTLTTQMPNTIEKHGFERIFEAIEAVRRCSSLYGANAEARYFNGALRRMAAQATSLPADTLAALAQDLLIDHQRVWQDSPDEVGCGLCARAARLGLKSIHSESEGATDGTRLGE